jgi:uncharacterized protein YqhQ
MPRVHPRCGTNLAAGVGVFLGIFALVAIPDEQVRAILGALGALLLWRRVGSLLQYTITTRPPSKKNLESGIRAGRELLENYSQAKVVRPSIPLYIWSSGMLHVVAGTFLCGSLVQLVAWMFKLDWLNLVK